MSRFETSKNRLLLTGRDLTTSDVARVAMDPSCEVGLDESAIGRMQASREQVESWVKGRETIYGITTGFGEFANVVIGADDIETLQANLIRSHSVGAGDTIPIPVVRAMMVLRANALALGNSGIRVETVRTLLAMLNANVIPVVFAQGSVGSSGDLVPLAHLILAAMGEGQVWSDDGRSHVDSGPILERKGIKPLRLMAKEGLALINGTQYMTAFGSLVVDRTEQLLRAADIIGALSLEALKGTDRAFHPLLHSVRPHPGQQVSARNLMRLIAESGIRESHRYDDDRVQDAYSIRCMPQIHGASRDTLSHAKRVLEIEINSATDNPLVFPDEELHVEGGNFHGQPVALVLDFLAIGNSELANVSERRTERLVNGHLSRLPRFLTERGGLNSGMMIAQYTAASVVSENKVLTHPASVDSIPTSANQEDHNSMGSIAARKAHTVTDNVATVLAIEYLCAIQGIDFLSPLQPGPGLCAARDLLRRHVPHLDEDRALWKDVKSAVELIKSGALQDAVERALGDPLE